ncbi:MAG: hypothetical protein M1840_008484 [Geoglossum simile]|nr:MAG: hypothetical protein M1840_008484 [Geoglossum simile]
MYHAAKFQKKAKELGRTKRTEVWWHCYLSGSVSLASRMLPAQPAELVDDGNFRITEKSKNTIARWHSIALFSHKVISGLYDTWKEKSFLINHALAERNYTLSAVADLGFKHLMKVTNGVVQHMRDSIPEFNISQPLLDPTLYLSKLMRLSYSVMCEALQIPSLDHILGALTTPFEFQPLSLLTETNFSHFSSTTAIQLVYPQSGTFLESIMPGSLRDETLSNQIIYEDSLFETQGHFDSQDYFVPNNTYTGPFGDLGLFDTDIGGNGCS